MLATAAGASLAPLGMTLGVINEKKRGRASFDRCGHPEQGGQASALNELHPAKIRFCSGSLADAVFLSKTHSHLLYVRCICTERSGQRRLCWHRGSVCGQPLQLGF